MFKRQKSICIFNLTNVLYRKKQKNNNKSNKIQQESHIKEFIYSHIFLYYSSKLAENCQQISENNFSLVYWSRTCFVLIWSIVLYLWNIFHYTGIKVWYRCFCSFLPVFSPFILFTCFEVYFCKLFALSFCLKNRY